MALGLEKLGAEALVQQMLGFDGSQRSIAVALAVVALVAQVGLSLAAGELNSKGVFGWAGERGGWGGSVHVRGGILVMAASAC